MILDVFRNMFILTRNKELGLFKMKVISEIDHNVTNEESTVRIVRRYVMHTYQEVRDVKLEP